MLIEMHNGTTQARFWLEASVTWAASVSDRFGTASFDIPRDHPVWRSGVLTPDGGQLVRISDGQSVFASVANAPEWDADGARITALDIAEWVGKRTLQRRREFRAVPAAIIASRAIRDAFIGSAVLPVTLGPCAIGVPLLSYTFDGSQTVQQVLTWLRAETGHEWGIDHATYQFRWQPSVGRYHDGLLTDIGDLFPSVRGRDLTERYQRVTEVDSRTRRTFTATNMTVPPLWPATRILEV